MSSSVPPSILPEHALVTPPATNIPAMSPTSKGTTVVNRPPRCCGVLGSIVGSIVSTGRHHAAEETLQQRHERPASQSSDHQQVAMGEMERELEKQKELRLMYKNRMERTQDYLKFCLQVAQDNGFLHLIVDNGGSSTPSTPTMETKTAVAASLEQGTCLLPPPETACNNSKEGVSPLLRLPSEQSLSDLTHVVEQAKYEGWYVEPDEVELEEEVARGTTAEIYRATWRGSEVAIKRLFPDFFCSNPNGAAFFAQEIETLSRQRHRFVLRLLGACLDPPDRAWIVTEFLETTMKEWLHGCGNRQAERSVPLPPLSERVRVAVEIAQAMQYLHGQKPKVIHRDLKPSNVFLDDGAHVRVADFGHARFLRDEEMALTGETGTYVYMAPEVIRCEPYDEKCDVYSFAVILNELISGTHPYIDTGFGPSKIAFGVAEGNLRPALPERDSGPFEDLIRLITASWDQDPSNRPPFSKITHDLRGFQQGLAEKSPGSNHDA